MLVADAYVCSMQAVLEVVQPMLDGFQVLTVAEDIS
jgi:hypothetical protein